MSDILKETLEYVVELAIPTVVNHPNVPGLQVTDKPFKPIPMPDISKITTATLSGLCDLIKAEHDPSAPPWYVKVVSPTLVSVVTPPRADLSRAYPMEAKAELPALTFDKFLDIEAFLIMLKARYLPGEDRDNLIGVLGTITEESAKTNSDDGISQIVTARAGVNAKEHVNINPIRKLQPYRTFLEVEQPTSEFLLRLKEGPTAALFEADGGAWKLAAVKSIVEFLETQLYGVDGVIVVR